MCRILLISKSSPLGMSDLFSTWISILELWIFESLELSADFHCSSKFKNSNKYIHIFFNQLWFILVLVLCISAVWSCLLGSVMPSFLAPGPTEGFQTYLVRMKFESINKLKVSEFHSFTFCFDLRIKYPK